MKTYRAAVIFLLSLWMIPVSEALEITVIYHDKWSEIRHERLQRFCEDVASHFEKHLRHELEMNEIIEVFYHPDGPYVYFDGDKHRIAISARAVHLHQFAYQLSHEITHVLHNHEITIIDNPNKWFQESICMVSSIWLLKEMADVWQTDAPYKNWGTYHKKFSDYADVAMVRDEVLYFGTAAQWIEEYEGFLRSDHKNDFTHHLLVAQLSHRFLPIFEKYPSIFNAIRQIPDSKDDIFSYISDWGAAVPDADKKYIQMIASIIKEDTNMVEENKLYTRLSFGDTMDGSITPINFEGEWSGWVAGVWEKFIDGKVTYKPGGYALFDEAYPLNHWIYSHAVSNIQYDISEVEHNYFSAYFLMPNDGCDLGSSMTFNIYADGVEVHSEDLFYKDYGKFIEAKIPDNANILHINVDPMGVNYCDHFVLGEPRLTNNGGVITTKKSVTTKQPNNQINYDINKDGYIDLQDVIIVRAALTTESKYMTDLDNDGITNIDDLLIIKSAARAAINAAAPSLIRHKKITTWGALKIK